MGTTGRRIVGLALAGTLFVAMAPDADAQERPLVDAMLASGFEELGYGTVIDRGDLQQAGAAAPNATAPMTAADAMFAAAFDELVPAEGGATFTPASRPSVPDEGRPIEILEASIVAFDLGRPPTQSDLLVSDGLGVAQLNEGSAAFGANQTAATVVAAKLDRPPDLGGNAISNVSLAWTIPGLPVLEASEFENDPLLGKGFVVDRGSAQDTDFTGYQQIVDGVWQPFADPTPTVEGYTGPAAQGIRAAPLADGGYLLMWIVFGLVEDAAVISSHAATPIPEALYGATVELAPPTMLRRLDEIETTDGLLMGTTTRDQFIGTDAGTPEEDAAPPPEQDAPPPPEQDATPPPQQDATPPPEQDATPPPQQDATPPPEQDAAPPPEQEDGTGSSSDGGAPWVPIGLALVAGLVLLGFLLKLFWPGTGAGTGDEDGAGDGDDGAEPPGFTPVPPTRVADTRTGQPPIGGDPTEGGTAPPVPPAEHEQGCDWGVVYVDGGNRRRLKTPVGVSAGDYVVSITSDVIDPVDEHWSQHRDELKRQHSHIARIYADSMTWGLPVGSHLTAGYHTHLRTESSGQALGPPYPELAARVEDIDEEPDSVVRDSPREHDARPEQLSMKARSSLVERTRISIEFVPGEVDCGIEAAHRFELDGRSRADIAVATSCTRCEDTSWGPVYALGDKFDKVACDVEMYGEVAVNGAVSSNGSFGYPLIDESKTTSIEGTPGSVEAGVQLMRSEKSLFSKFLLLINDSREHNATKAGDPLSNTGTGFIDGTRLDIDLDLSLGVLAKMLTAGPATIGPISAPGLHGSTKVEARVNCQHQVNVFAAASGPLTCPCPPPKLALRFGPPVELGTAGPGEQENTMPSCADGVDAELDIDGRVVGIRRVEDRWVIVD